MISPDRPISPIVLIQSRIVLNGHLIIRIKLALYLICVLLWRTCNFLAKMAIIVINSQLS